MTIFTFSINTVSLWNSSNRCFLTLYMENQHKITIRWWFCTLIITPCQIPSHVGADCIFEVYFKIVFGVKKNDLYHGFPRALPSVSLAITLRYMQRLPWSNTPNPTVNVNYTSHWLQQSASGWPLTNYMELHGIQQEFQWCLMRSDIRTRL